MKNSSVSLFRPFPSVRGWLPLALLLTFAFSGGAAQALRLPKGDVTLDGAVSVDDAVGVLRAIVGSDTFDDTRARVADVNGSGDVAVDDAVLILRAIVGLVPDLGFLDLDGATVSVTVLNNETVFSWPKAGGETFAKLEFTQDGKSVTLTGAIASEGGQGRYTVHKRITSQPAEVGSDGNDYVRFRDFLPNVPVRVSVAVGGAEAGPFTPAGGATFVPVVHGFDPEFTGPQPPSVTLSLPFPDRVNAGDTVAVTGVALGPLRAKAYYVPPTGFPVEVSLQSAQSVVEGDLGPGLQGGSDFAMSFKAAAEGVYNVEVNQYDGSAALNRPVYVGAGVPLVPGPLDFYALPAPGAPVSPDLFDRWLAAVNQDRRQYGLSPVAFDPNLMKAAQDYSNDMVARNFFSHTGINGDSLLDARLKAAGVPSSTQAGENIALHTTPEALEAGLMASAGHRTTILNPQFRFVGLGITRNAEGSLVGVQEFGAPVGAYTHPVDFYPDVILDQPLPSNLVAGQSYTLSGKVTRPTLKITMAFQDVKDPQNLIVLNAVNVGADGRFTVNILLTPAQIGNYGLALFRDANPGRLADVVVTLAPLF